MGLEKALLINSIIMFCAVCLACVFAAHCVTVWIRNQREARSRQHKHREEEILRRADADRLEWSSLLAEKDKQIEQLLSQVTTLSGALSRTKQLLSVSEEMRSKA